MDYIAKVPNSVLTADVTTPVLNLNSNHILNGFFTGVHEVDGDIEATNQGGNGAVAEYGETLTVPTTGGTHSGAYIASITLASSNVTIGLPPLVGINVKLNDIEGHVFRDDDGSAYMLSDQPMTSDRLGVTASLVVSGIPFEVDVPLSEVGSALVNAINAHAATLPLLLRAPFITAAGLVNGVTNITQQVLDNTVLNVGLGFGTLDVVCFARGTLISTDRGIVAVEDLRVGDRVLTKDHDYQKIRWIGENTISQQQLQANPNLRPIRIRRGALGTNVPSTDLVVSPQHRVLIVSRIAQRMFGTTEILVAAKQLLELDGVEVAEDLKQVDYFHMLFDRHEIVLSNGAETESLYTGPQALKSVGKAALSEIFLIFPELQNHDYSPVSARNIPNNKQARKMVLRHIQNHKPLVTSGLH